MTGRPESGNAGPILRAALLALGPLAAAVALTAIIARLDGLAFADVVLLPPEPLAAFRFLLGLAASIVGIAAVIRKWSSLRCATVPSSMTLPSSSHQVV